MKIVDPHIHFWDANSGNYPWLKTPSVVYSGDNRLLPRCYDANSLLKEAEAAGLDVVGTVHVEANPKDPIAEVQWLQAMAESESGRGHPSGIVAHTDLSQPNAPRTLESLARHSRVRGIRQILNQHSDSQYNYVAVDYLGNTVWLENLRYLERFGWSFDLQLYPHQAAAAARVARDRPGILFIVNHAGMFVDRNSVLGWRQWRTAMRLLASCENVVLKISGLAMFDHRWTVESFRPLVLESIDAFGANRSMFASNSPIDCLHSRYVTLWESYMEIVSGSTQSEAMDLFASNASRYYRLDPQLIRANA